MRKWGIAVGAALLILAGGVARAEDRPTDVGSSSPGSEPGTKPVETRSIEVAGIALSVDGKTVEAVPPGENVIVVLNLRNNLESTVRNVRVHAEAIKEGRVRITDADATVDSIATGATETARIGVVADKDDCEDFAYFAGEIRYDGGTAPLSVGFRVACPGPRLYLHDVIFSGGDGDGVPEPGETVKVTIVLLNEGRDPAKGVRAKVAIESDKISTQNDDLAWPDIGPGKTARSASPLTLVIADDAERQKGSCDDVRTLPAPGAVGDQGSVPPDTAVSSDGSVSSEPATPTELPAPSEPGSAGGGAPGSTGSDTPFVVEPNTGTATPEPLPATVRPVPEPGTIEPQPKPADQPVEIAIKVSLTASNYKTTFGFSNQIFCALEGRAVTDTKHTKPASASDARGDAAGSAGGGAALPLLVAALASAGAIGGRRLLAR